MGVTMDLSDPDLEYVDGDRHWWYLETPGESPPWFNFCTLSAIVESFDNGEFSESGIKVVRPATNADKKNYSIHMAIVYPED